DVEEPAPLLRRRAGRRRAAPPAEPEPSVAPPPESEPAALPAGAPSTADLVARFPAAIETIAQEAIAAFPLEEVNRWLGSGTIFQIRGALAFLNLRSMGGVKVDELRSHIRRMGFADELGRLAAEGLAGEVL